MYSEHEIELAMRAHSCSREEAIEKYCEMVRTSIEQQAAEFEKTKYKRLRAAEYPSFAEQFDLLFHGGYETWKDVISKVKEKYPKPQE